MPVVDIPLFKPREQIKKNPSLKVLIIGHPGCGKSWLVKEFFYLGQDIYPVSRVWHGSEDTTSFYSSFTKSLYVSTEYTDRAFNHMIYRQKKVVNDKGNAKAIICFDDIGADPSIFNAKKSPFRVAAKNARNWGGVMLIFVIHHISEINRLIRSIPDFVFLFKTASREDVNDLFRFFGGAFENKRQFTAIYQQCTGEHKCMVIDLKSQSTKLKDKVYWYKAHDLTDWKNFGCFEYKVWANTRYDRNWQNRHFEEIEREMNKDED